MFPLLLEKMYLVLEISPSLLWNRCTQIEHLGNVRRFSLSAAHLPLSNERLIGYFLAFACVSTAQCQALLMLN